MPAPPMCRLIPMHRRSAIATFSRTARSAPSLPTLCAQKRLVLSTAGRSEEHTSELQSLMRISYAVFCLKNNTIDHFPPTPAIIFHPTHTLHQRPQPHVSEQTPTVH